MKAVKIKKEKRPVFRFIRAAAKPGEEDSKRPRIYMKDNHLGPHFGGFAHDVPDIISASDILAKYREMLEAAKYPPLSSRNLIGGVMGAFNDASRNCQHITYEIHDEPKKSFHKSFSEEPDYQIRLPVTEEQRLKQEAIKRQAEQEKEEEFRRAASWRFRETEPKTDMDAAWDALQAALEPSMHDQDKLGTFHEWLKFFPTDRQFLLIGDTNHHNPKIQNWLTGEEQAPGEELLQVLADAGFKDLVVEYNPRIKNSAVDAYRKKAAERGIHVHVLDTQVGTLRDYDPDYYLKRLKHDQILAGSIKSAVGNRKAAIAYGAGHFCYEHTLHDLLGRENCRHIDVHADLQDYLISRIKMNATYLPSYVYLIKEGEVIVPRGNIRREIPASQDEMVMQGIRRLEQENAVQEFLAMYQINVPGSCDNGVVHPHAVVRSLGLEEYIIPCDPFAPPRRVDAPSIPRMAIGQKHS